MMAGGGIQGGQVYGKSDAKGVSVAENPVTPQDFNATIAYAMGIKPNLKIMSRIGRPFALSNEGEPIKALF